MYIFITVPSATCFSGRLQHHWHWQQQYLWQLSVLFWPKLHQLTACLTNMLNSSGVQLKCDGTRRTGGGSEGGNWRMEWVATTLHTTSEHGVSSITTADALTSAASSQLNWRPRRFKWTRPFRRKTKSVFCACAVTFQTQSAVVSRAP